MNAAEARHEAATSAETNAPPRPALLAFFREKPELADRLIGELASHADQKVRMWAIGFAMDTLGTDATPHLIRLAADAHPDVRDEAIQYLVQSGAVGRDALVRLARAKLPSRDPVEPLTALWILAAANATELIPEIERLREKPARPWHVPTISAVLMLLDGGDKEVLRRLRGHDHELTRDLAVAAVMLHSDEAKEALRYGTEHLPDAECRNWCQYALDQLWNDAHHAGLATLRAAAVGLSDHDPEPPDESAIDARA